MARITSIRKPRRPSQALRAASARPRTCLLIASQRKVRPKTKNPMTIHSSKAPAQISQALPIPALPPTGFIRQAQVLALIPISKSTLWRQVAAGTFPAPVKLTLRVTAWRAEAIRIWIAERGSFPDRSDTSGCRSRASLAYPGCLADSALISVATTISPLRPISRSATEDRRRIGRFAVA